MKKLILLSIVLAFTAGLNAQTVDKKLGIGGAFGAYGTLNNGGIGIMPELYLSRYLSPKLDIMLKGDFGVFRTGLKSNLDLVNPFINLRYKFTDETKNLRPYLYAGPGFLADNGTSGLNFDLGAGSKYYVKPNAAIYFEAGFFRGIESTNRENIWKVTAGLEYDLGKAKDSDMDGVSDNKDKCPDTPAGVAVDAKGCPVDTDGDGIADYLDDCPTVAGLTSLKGCPDKDKDGVADKDDACPDVPGLASLKGCPDADGDGVADKSDKCPDTPKGWKVDEFGCPLDQDKDGVADAIDACPTVAGPKENKGCPVKEEEKEVGKKKEITAEQVVIQNIKVSPVHFLSDKSYLTNYSKGILEKLIKTLNSDQAYHVNIYGHTDSQGSDPYNIKLSQDRIDSVVKHLVSKGISENRIINQKAFGKSKPIATNKTPEGRLQNRRVEFEILKMK